MSVIVGVDLAASPENTGLAVLDGAHVRVEVGVDDARIVEACAGAGRIGIDCPLGWPDAFVAFVRGQAAGEALPPAGTVAEREPLVYRATDVYWRTRGHRPLSVSADRIGHAALRCAALLPRLDPSRDRSGEGRVVETYPAGSLARWGLRSRGYKGGVNRDVLAALAAQVADRFGLVVDDPRYATSDHAFDAVVAALTARSPLEPVPDGYGEIARREGWIRIPA